MGSSAFGKWPLVALGSLTSRIRSGATPKGGQAAYLPTRDHFVLVRSQNVFDHNFDTTGLANISDVQAAGLHGAELQPSDVLLNITGDGVTFGRACLIPESVLPACVNQHVVLIRANETELHAGYLAAWLALPETKSYIESFNAGGSRRAITKGHIESFQVPLPPLSVQNEIGELASSLNSRIDLLRQTNITLEAIAQALFKSWFVDFDPVRAKAEGREPEAMDAATAALFRSEFEDSELGPIPKGWRMMPLLDACDLLGGTQPPASTFIDEPKAGYVRLLQIRDFSTDAHLTYIPDSKKLRTAQVDDILIGRYGSASGNKQKDSLGRICRGLEGAYNVALMKLVPGSVGREFAFQVFNDQNFYNYLQGVSAKAVQSGFSKKELALYKIVVPDDQVLERYESMGSAVWQQVKLKRQQMATLAQLRDTLLPRLISGKLRLPEAAEAANAAVA